MNNSSISALSLLLVALATTTTSVSAIKFQFNTASCDGDPFNDLDIDVTCDGDASPDCLFGDVAIIDGTVEAVQNFTNSQLTFKACMWGYCPEDNIRTSGYLCNWLTPIENQTCGLMGMYNVTGSEVIPVADITDRYSWLVTVKIGIEEECTAEGTSDESNTSYTSYRMNYSMMGAVFGVAFGAAVVARKKCQGEEEDEDYSHASPFIEMRDACISPV